MLVDHLRGRAGPMRWPTTRGNLSGCAVEAAAEIALPKAGHPEAHSRVGRRLGGVEEGGRMMRSATRSATTAAAGRRRRRRRRQSLSASLELELNEWEERQRQRGSHLVDVPSLEDHDDTTRGD